MSIHFDGAAEEVLLTPDLPEIIEIDGRVQPIVKNVLLGGEAISLSGLSGSLTV